MFEAIGRGEIKAVWIACTNPAQSMPDANAVRKALARAEFVVVQEAFRDAETCDYADVLLPAASWGEKEGTVTNSERRISRVRAAVAPPGEARADWQIAVDFARRFSPAGAKLFPYQNPEQIFNEHRESTRGRDLDITGLSYGVLERDGPQQWPYPEGARSGLHAPLRRRRLPDALGTRALRRHRVPAPGRRAGCAIPAAADHGTPARPMAQHDAHRARRAPVQPQPGAGNRRQ